MTFGHSKRTKQLKQGGSKLQVARGTCKKHLGCCSDCANGRKSIRTGIRDFQQHNHLAHQKPSWHQKITKMYSSSQAQDGPGTFPSHAAAAWSKTPPYRPMLRAMCATALWSLCTSGASPSAPTWPALGWLEPIGIRRCGDVALQSFWATQAVEHRTAKQYETMMVHPRFVMVDDGCVLADLFGPNSDSNHPKLRLTCSILQLASTSSAANSFPTFSSSRSHLRAWISQLVSSGSSPHQLGCGSPGVHSQQGHLGKSDHGPGHPTPGLRGPQ